MTSGQKRGKQRLDGLGLFGLYKLLKIRSQLYVYVGSRRRRLTSSPVGCGRLLPDCGSGDLTKAYSRFRQLEKILVPGQHQILVLAPSEVSQKIFVVGLRLIDLTCFRAKTVQGKSYYLHIKADFQSFLWNDVPILPILARKWELLKVSRDSNLCSAYVSLVDAMLWI